MPLSRESERGAFFVGWLDDLPKSVKLPFLLRINREMNVRRGMILLAVLALLLSIAGCGGGSGDDTLTQQEFTEELKEVCVNGREARRVFLRDVAKEYYEERETPPTNAYQAKNLLKLMSIVQDTTAEIADIGLPEGNEKEVEEWIRLREEAAAKVEASPIGTRDNLQALFESSYAKARALGVGTCDL